MAPTGSGYRDADCEKNDEANVVETYFHHLPNAEIVWRIIKDESRGIDKIQFAISEPQGLLGRWCFFCASL